MSYEDSHLGQTRRASKRREIEEALDEELESFVNIDFYGENEHDDEWKNFLNKCESYFSEESEL